MKELIDSDSEILNTVLLYTKIVVAPKIYMPSKIAQQTFVI